MNMLVNGFDDMLQVLFGGDAVMLGGRFGKVKFPGRDDLQGGEGGTSHNELEKGSKNIRTSARGAGYDE